MTIRPTRPRSAHTLAPLCLSVCLLGCTGAIAPASDEGRPGDPSKPGGGAGNGGTPSGDDEASLPNIRSSDGLRPLTRREYVESVDQLLGVRPELAAAPLETLVAGHSKIARGQEIVRGEIEKYYELGALAAEAAVAKLTCNPVTEACAKAFAQPFLKKAFRGELSDELETAYVAMLSNTEAGDTVRDRLVTLISAALNSPLFLYRKEVGQGAVSAGTRALEPMEVAARMAYLVWEAPPDDELIAAAAAGKLADAQERASQLERMLAAPRARSGLRSFVGDWMGLIDPESRITLKNPEVLKGTPPDLESRALASLDATVDRVLDGGAGSFLAVLDTDAYLADDTITTLLGAQAGSKELALLRLDTASRRGILLHPAVLAAHTTEGGASPFPIGKFIYQNMLCGVLGNIPEIPPLDESELGDKTLRQRLEEVTSPPPCQTCHAKIGPPGFAFLSYDVLGRHRPNDAKGAPLDTAGTLALETAPISFENAAELSGALAKHPQAARCVARRLFRWTFGHFEAAGDEALLEKLGTQAAKDGAGVAPLLTALVRSDEFTRVRTEAP